MKEFQKIIWCIACLLVVNGASGQDRKSYNFFSIKGEDLYWSYTYQYKGSRDSLRGEIVPMLKSKYYTFNVFKTETGYNGEINHYKVNAKKYGRTYLNTDRMYWTGEWSGKFIIEVLDNMYRVTVYGLYGEVVQKNPANFRQERVVKGRYYDIVTRADGKTFRRSELNNMQLMGISLKDEFDIRNTVSPTN